MIAATLLLLSAASSAVSPSPCFEPDLRVSPPGHEQTLAGTYTVPTFAEELIDINSRRVEREFGFPVYGHSWNRVLLHYQLTCPGGGCDPWDRSASMYILAGEDEQIEIARVITPYNLACGWTIDVTPYLPLLRGDVVLGIFIDTWVGGGVGWLVTADFTFYEGVLEPEPVQIERLWHGSPEMGNYLRWLEGFGINDDFFSEREITVPADVVRTELRFSMTGHGQGNTLNAGEFIELEHWLEVEGEEVARRRLWRDDCDQNPCSPQGGTWRFNRAGWCPGSDSPMWSVDISDLAPPGESVRLDYFLDDYVNFCTADNPDCDVAQHCMPFAGTCAYNGSTHTTPTLWTESQVVFYRSNPECDLRLDVRERPCSLAPGAEARLTYRTTNFCAAGRAFDEVVIQAEGPAQFQHSFAIDPPIEVSAGGSEESLVEFIVPMQTPPGLYILSVSALRSGALLGSDQIRIRLE